ncbi:MAG: hypothetical protein EHM24_18845 [Acidobacteria bacterium]|nr:MAG: hypothetical protein EHM24_18845 [Acidobacteriota bacterium]
MSRSRKTPGDQAVRDRIVSDFDRNFLVEAGAGSGKTYSLARRMAAGIERGVYRVEGMAAVTFTRKAAAELRARFQEALEERLREAKGAGEQVRLREALEGIERLFAGTIHAFCAHLLRERPVDARVAPGFEELGDVDNLRLRRQAWRDFVAERRAAGCGAMLDLLDAGVLPKDLDDAFAIVCENEDVEFDGGEGAAPDAGPVWPEVERFWAQLTALRPPRFPEETTCPVQRRFEADEGRLRYGRRDRAASLANFLKAWEKPKVTQCYWDGTGKQVKNLVDAFAVAVAQPFMTSWRAYVHRLAMAVLIDARDYYAAVRRRRNAVNYVDLLQVTARMLRECPHVRLALRSKYRWLFIDEFQDTDPIQAEIFLALAGDEDGGLRPGSLFVVGDPKQSIFRFRRADIDIYNRVAARIEETGGSRLLLTANFRSLPGVCALANEVFPPLFGALSAPWSPPFQALDPVRNESEVAAGPRVAALTLPDAGKGAEQSEVEAEAIARYVRSEVAAGRRGYGDFLVLTRNKPRLGLCSTAFSALEIPVEVSGAGFFCKAPEVKALALLLTALADPLDPVSLVGVLRGPMFGLSDPELFRFRQAGGRLEIGSPLPQCEEPCECSRLEESFGPVLPAMRHLQSMLHLTRSLPLPAAVDRILEETGWLALAATQPAGAAAGRLLQVVDRVRAVVEEGGGLADAADALDEEETSNEAEALPLEPGRRNVVRLMNLHKAKGLEAPVVILADATHDYEFPLAVRVVRTGATAKGFLRVACKARQGFGWVVVGQPRDWAAHEEAERKYVEAERLRLLYVAGTRAEELLVVCRSAKAAANKVWREFTPFLAGAPELDVPEVKTSGGKRAADVSPTARAAAVEAREAAFARARVASWAARSVTRLRSPSECASEGGGDSYGGAESGASRTADAGDVGPGGVSWGSLIHGLLEHAVRHPGAARADLDRLARWLTVETPELRPFISEGLDLVEAILRAPFWAEVRGAEAVHVEVPFAVRVEAGRSLGDGDVASVPTVVQGVIDLAYRARDGWRILDYKTDRLPSYDPSCDGIVLARHGGQLAQYRAAWEQVTGEPVRREGIVLVRGGRTAWAPPE